METCSNKCFRTAEEAEIKQKQKPNELENKISVLMHLGALIFGHHSHHRYREVSNLSRGIIQLCSDLVPPFLVSEPSSSDNTNAFLMADRTELGFFWVPRNSILWSCLNLSTAKEKGEGRQRASKKARERQTFFGRLILIQPSSVVKAFERNSLMN